MTDRYDICSGRKDKDGKTRWTKLGAMFASRNGEGFSIKLDALPLPDEKGDVWLSAFVPKERDEAPRQPARHADRGSAPVSPSRGAPNLDDDIPFSCGFYP